LKARISEKRTAGSITNIDGKGKGIMKSPIVIATIPRKIL
jgi:hypothetical protein